MVPDTRQEEPESLCDLVERYYANHNLPIYKEPIVETPFLVLDEPAMMVDLPLVEEKEEMQGDRQEGVPCYFFEKTYITYKGRVCDNDYLQYIRNTENNINATSISNMVEIYEEGVEEQEEGYDLFVDYVVKPDETLEDVLTAFNMTMEEFTACNKPGDISLCAGKCVKIRNNNAVD